MKYPKPDLPFSVVARLLVSKTNIELERERDGNRVSLNVTKLTVLNKIQLFFLNKHSLAFCKYFNNFQSFEKK